MGLNICLFVHGVPMGQKIWGPQGEDQRYLSSFYGPKWDTPEVMKVEIMTLGGVTNSYYSFVKGQNVCDSQGRAGSYFALTLRINAFYTDVQNVYNILKAAYEKMCVGLCVKDSGTTAKYLVADFQTVDSQLKNIEKHILNYVGEFSVNEDIVQFPVFPVNPQGSSMNINLYECTKSVALDCMKKQGLIMTSPCFLSTSAAKTVDRYKEEMEATKQRAQQELLLQQRTSQEMIDDITQKSQAQVATIRQEMKDKLQRSEERSKQQIAQANAENERRIQELRRTYSSADEKIGVLKRKNKELEDEVSNLRRLCKQQQKELQSSKARIQELDGSARISQDDHSRTDGDMVLWGFSKPEKYVVDKTRIITCVFGFFVVLLVALLINWLIGIFDDSKDKKESGVDESSFTIIIKECSTGEEVSSVECGKPYKVSLDSDADTLNGTFYGPAFSTKESGYLIAKRDSVDRDCWIYYVCGSDTITKRKVKITKKK